MGVGVGLGAIRVEVGVGLGECIFGISLVRRRRR